MANSPKQRRTRLDPQERREQLLKCAIRIFAKHGIARATQSQVAKCAGISVSAVYSYFRTREELVSATVNEVGAFVDTLFTTTLPNKQSSHDELVELAYAFLEIAKEKPDFVKVWLDWSTGMESPFWASYLDCWGKLQKHVGSSLRQAKRDGLAPENLNIKAGATLFISGAHTIIQLYFCKASKAELDTFIEQLVSGSLGVEPIS